MFELNYEVEVGKNHHAVIALHGTGGSARDLFDIVKFLDPQTTRIGFEGEVIENEMRRFFARFPDGSFDLESLAKGTTSLKESIDRVIERYDLKNHSITILGYSNGANIAVNLLKEFEDFPIAHAILLHPSPITPGKALKKQKNLKVLISSGKHDPYISETEFNHLKEAFMDGGIDVETFVHNHGHKLTQDEINAAKKFLEINLKEYV